VVVSARPDNMDSCVATCERLDSELLDAYGSLSAALGSFEVHNEWGSLSASGLVNNVGMWISANGLDNRWLRTVAQAFRDADARGAELCHATDVQIGLALANGGFVDGRFDLWVMPSMAVGGPQTSGYASDPVNVASGNFVEVEIDLGFGPALRWLQVRRTYNSLDSEVGPFGPGWSSWASARLRRDGAGRVASLRGPDGEVVEVPLSTGTVAGFGGRVSVAEDGGVVEFGLEGLSWRFDAEGRPAAIDHGPSNGVVLTWDGERLVRLGHVRGRSVAFQWDGRRIVAAVADDGRRVDYRYDETGRLVEVQGPLGIRRYEWDTHRGLLAVEDGDHVVTARNTYDRAGRVSTQQTAAGRLVRFSYHPDLSSEVIGDPDGSTSRWLHDEAGRLVQVVDGAGRATTKAYDDEGRVVAVIDRRDGTTSYRRDRQGHCVRVERPDGAVVALEWDELSRCVAATGPDEETCRYSYRADERIPSRIVDPEGGVTHVEVVDGLVRQVVDPDGVVLQFAYDDQGHVVAVTDGDGATTRYDWDRTGQMVAATSPLGHREEVERDAAGYMVRRRTADGAIWRIERSPAGRVLATEDPTGARRVLRRGRHGNVIEDIDPTGAVTRLEWDEQDALVSVVQADGGHWDLTHDPLLRVTEVSDPGGAIWRREYDAEGTPVATISPTGARRSVGVNEAGRITGIDDGRTSVAFGYDRVGRAVAHLRPDGSGARAAYDRCGRIVEVTEATGGVTRFTYSPGGRLTSVVGPTGARIGYDYDHLGRLRVVTGPAGSRRRFRYDRDGRLVRVVEPTGETTRYAYDPVGRVTAVTNPAGGVTRYVYDAVGRPVEVIGPDGAVTRTGYDAAGRAVSVVDPNGGEVRFERDVMGRVVAQVDPTGARWERRLDTMGRPVETIDPLGRATRFTYDVGGRLVSRTDADGGTQRWRWDDSDRLVAWGSDGVESTVERDLLGRVVRITGADGATVTREWDADGLLLAETTGAVTMRWARDGAGNVVAAAIERPGLTATTTYELDPAGRPTVIHDPTMGEVVIERDVAGRPVRVAGATRVEERRWEAGRLTGWTCEVTGLPEASVELSYDPAGRRVTEEHGDGRCIRYGYDRAGQLVAVRVGESIRRFEWDAVGRLIRDDTPNGTRRFGYDRAGQLTSIVGRGEDVRFDWDACGRRVAELGPYGERRYHWGPAGQLDGIETTGADGVTGRRRLSYDALGRLAAIDGIPLVWDPARPIEELRVVGDHVLAAAGGLPHMAAAWPNGNGAVPDPWGGVVAAPSNGYEPSGPVGLEVDCQGELNVDGLVWLRARAYDPATRSFLSPDPLPGLTGHPWGSNPYHYAANDPIGWSDPTGLRPLTDQELAEAREHWNESWFDRNAGWIVGGLMIVGAAAVFFVPGIGPVASSMIIGGLVSGGASAMAQQAFTGQVDWTQVAVSSVIGVGAGGLGYTVGTMGGLAGLSPLASGAVWGMTESAAFGMTARATFGQNPFDPSGLATDVLAGGVSGGVGGYFGGVARPPTDGTGWHPTMDSMRPWETDSYGWTVVDQGIVGASERGIGAPPQYGFGSGEPGPSWAMVRAHGADGAQAGFAPGAPGRTGPMAPGVGRDEGQYGLGAGQPGISGAPERGAGPPVPGEPVPGSGGPVPGSGGPLR